MGYTKRKGGGKAPKATKQRREAKERRQKQIEQVIGKGTKVSRARKDKRSAKNRMSKQRREAVKMAISTMGPAANSLKDIVSQGMKNVGLSIYKQYLSSPSIEDKPISDLGKSLCNVINGLSNLNTEDFHKLGNSETRELFGEVHQNLRVNEMHNMSVVNKPSKFVKLNKKYFFKYPSLKLSIEALTQKLNNYALTLENQEYQEYLNPTYSDDVYIKALMKSINNALLNGNYLDRSGEGVDYYQDWISRLFE